MRYFIFQTTKVLGCLIIPLSFFASVYPANAKYYTRYNNQPLIESEEAPAVEEPTLLDQESEEERVRRSRPLPQSTIPARRPSSRIQPTPVPKNRIPRNTAPRNPLPRNRIPSSNLPRTRIPSNPLPRNVIPRSNLPRTTIPRNPLPRNKIPSNKLPRNRVPSGPNR